MQRQNPRIRHEANGNNKSFIAPFVTTKNNLFVYIDSDKQTDYEVKSLGESTEVIFNKTPAEGSIITILRRD